VPAAAALRRSDQKRTSRSATTARRQWTSSGRELPPDRPPASPRRNRASRDGRRPPAPFVASGHPTWPANGASSSA
jgi:hypothetical protein